VRDIAFGRAPLRNAFSSAWSQIRWSRRLSAWLVRQAALPRQTWRTFLRNHAEAIAAIDLCVVPTLTFECLFVFLVVGHGRRQLLWFAVTRHPTAEWLSRQIVEAFPWDTAPTYLVRDNDALTGKPSYGVSGRWESATARYLRSRPGKIPMLSA
jgi:hypothetical protein